jgi:methylglutaconyl-CoA hydratase
MEVKIKVEQKGSIGYVTFGSSLHNAMSISLLEDLERSIEELSQKKEIKVVLIKSEGDGVFCAGASFVELKSINNREDGKIFFNGFAGIIKAMRRSSKLIVVRVQGKTVGGGVGIAAAGDYVFATQQATVRLSELTIGIGPYVIGPAVERKLGLAEFNKMCLSPDKVQNAEWALDKGLYQEVFGSIEEMDLALENYLDKFSKYSSPAIEGMKRMLWEGTSHWETLLDERVMTVSKLLLTDEAQNIIQKL